MEEILTTGQIEEIKKQEQFEALAILQARIREIQEDGQRLKDRFIETLMKASNDFNADWITMQNKIADINGKINKMDKLNK